MVLFMQAARWPDDIRTKDKAQNRPPWHYINLPFKPEGQPSSVQIREPEPVNILTAMAENESVVRKENDGERKAVALAWLFHLVGDIHQPLHTAQLFTVDYPQGDRGGNEICLRVTQGGQPMDLHRFWDGVITSSQNLTRLRNEATALRNRQEFQRSQLTELANTGFESWAKESFEIATKFAEFIVRPICFAALRLMMNSNFIGCSTGRSAGLAPFKILSTYVAARRSKSLMLGL
jgi:hypothetical protein